MAKLTLNDITSGFGSKDLLNSNSTLIETALENTLSLDGTTPNSMTADIDLNSNDLLNVNSTETASLKIGGTLVTTSAMTVNDASQVAYDQGATGSVATTVESKLQETVSVFDFMTSAQIADVVGNTKLVDVTVPIQAAVDTGLDIFFPQGRYLITSTITCNTRGQSFYGPLSTSGKEDITATASGAVFEFSIGDADPADEMFLVRLSQVSFSNLKFIGDSGNTSDIGIKFEKNDGNNDDMDGMVKDCGFYNWNYGIYFYGRALTATENTFSSITNSIMLDWPATGVPATPVLQSDDLYKGRGFRISDNKFHGGVGISVQNFVLRSAVISNNVSDICTQFLHVINDVSEAGTNGCIIDGNVMELSVQEPIDYEEATVCINTVISNNRIGGSIADTIDATSRRPFAAIVFDSIDTINGLSITGNAIYGTDAAAIVLRDTAVVVPTLIQGISVTNNLFAQLGLDVTIDRAIFISSYDITDFMFSNNMCNDLDSTVVSLVRTSSNTITNSAFRGNIYDSALPLTTTTTLAGTRDEGKTFGGTYTPAQVSTNTNVDAVVFSVNQYIRMGDVVTVSGNISVDTTAAADTLVRFSLPVASALVSSVQLAGVGTENQGLATVATLCGLSADAANDCARLRFTAAGTGAVNYVYTFTYLVV